MSANCKHAAKLTEFIMPDDENVDDERLQALSEWMNDNGLQTGPGSVGQFLAHPEFSPLRKSAAKSLLGEKKCREITAHDLSSAEADRLVSIFKSDGCDASKKKQGNTWTVTACCPL